MKEIEYPYLNRKAKKALRLLKQGHTVVCNEGTTEFRFIDNHFEMRYLDCTGEWRTISPEDVEEEVIEPLYDQDYIIDRKERIRIYFKIRFCPLAFFIGFYLDPERKILYFSPFPMVVFCFHFYRNTIYR